MGFNGKWLKKTRFSMKGSGQRKPRNIKDFSWKNTMSNEKQVSGGISIWIIIRTILRLMKTGL
jgi:hypothetical protein